jgi:hypothetical protein
LVVFNPQRLKHWRAFVFSAYGRKFKPPAMRVVVDLIYKDWDHAKFSWSDYKYPGAGHAKMSQ